VSGRFFPDDPDWGLAQGRLKSAGKKIAMSATESQGQSALL
jgi:hypothetical protein